MVLDVLLNGTERTPLVDGSTVSLDMSEGGGGARLRWDASSATFQPAVDDDVVIENVNHAQGSELIHFSPWENMTGTPVVTANDTTDPNGNETATLIDDDDAGTIERWKQDVTIPDDSTDWTFSIFVKQNTTATQSAVDIRLNGGTQVIVTGTITWSGPTISTGTLTDFGNGWWRAEITATNNSTGNTSARINVAPASNGASDTGSAWFWGAQLENASSASSYSARFMESRTILTGVITRIFESRDGRTGNKFVSEAEVADLTWKMHRRRFTKAYDGETDRFIIKDIITETGLDTDISAIDANIDEIDTNITIGFGDESAFQAIDDIATIADARWHLDGEGALHYNTEANAAAPSWNLSENPNLKGFFGPIGLTVERLWDNPVNKVTVIGSTDEHETQIIGEDEDTTSQTNHGVYAVRVENPNLSTQQLVDDVAATIIANNAEPGHRAQYRTFRDGMRPNMKQDLTTSTLGFTSETMLVRRVSFNQINVNTQSYDVELGNVGPTPEELARMLGPTSRKSAPTAFTGVEFNGSSHHITVADAASIQNLGAATEFTIAMWLRMDTYDPSGNTQDIVSKGEPSVRWRVHHTTASEALRLFVPRSTDFLRIRIPETDLPPLGTLFHFAATVTAGTPQGYLNGVAAGTTQTGSGSLNDDSGDDLFIAALDQGVSAEISHFDGFISHLVIWEKGLTPSFIRRIAARPSADAYKGIFPDQMVLALPLNDDSSGTTASTVLDISGKENDGTGQNSPQFKSAIYTP